MSQWIRERTDEELLVEEGALYPALYRMESKGWIEAEWGSSDNNRRAKFYALTPEGRRHLKQELDTWQRYTQAVSRDPLGHGRPRSEEGVMAVLPPGGATRDPSASTSAATSTRSCASTSTRRRRR